MEPPSGLSPSLAITISHQQEAVPLSETFHDELLRRAASAALDEGEISAGEVSIALVDDPSIAALHAEFMDLPDPTDVLTFVLSDADEPLEGEVVASGDTALASAAEYGWPSELELLLYVVHGCLHLAGYDDIDPSDRAEMRAAEARVFARLGLPAPPAERLAAEDAASNSKTAERS